MSKSKSRDARTQATRRSILDAACSCFAESGFSGTSTREIAARAAVTQPLIHHYFKSKKGLFHAVLDDAVRDYEQAQSTQWELDGSDPRFLTDGLAVMFEWLANNPRILRLMAWARLEGMAEPRAPQKALIDRVAARFAAAKQAGLIRPEVEILPTMMMIDLVFKSYWERAMGQSELYKNAIRAVDPCSYLIEFIVRSIVPVEHQPKFLDRLPPAGGIDM